MSKESFDSSLTAGHRERLRQKFLAGTLTPYEKFELALTYAIPRIDVRPISRRLYKKFGGTFGILSASFDDLCAIPGIGRSAAILIKDMQEILLDGYREYFRQDTVIFHKREQFDNYCKLLLGGKTVEEMHIIHMDDDGRLIEDQLHCVGTNDETPFYIREIIKRALELGTKTIAFVHNHPKPNTLFSKQDIALTKMAIDQLSAVDIRFIDHYLVSGGILYSMRDNHWLDTSNPDSGTSTSVNADISGTTGSASSGNGNAPES